MTTPLKVLAGSITQFQTGDAVPVTLGGTGLTSCALGDTLYASAANVVSKLTGNTTATKKFLSQTGTGTISDIPSWATVVSADIPVLDASKITTGTLGTARLGSGTASDQTWLRGDGTWARPVGSGICQGRLTLSSTVATLTSATTISTGGTLYFLPYNGNQISIYNAGTASWDVFTFTALSLTTTVANGVFDVFVVNSGGTLALTSVAWTSTTARATGLVWQDGVLVLSGSPGSRYLGTYAAVSGVISDSAGFRGVWNYYNRLRRKLYRQETTASWTYGVQSTWRYANANSANIVNVVVGWQDSWTEIRLMVFSTPTITQLASTGIGYDSGSATPVSDLSGRFGLQSMQNSSNAAVVHLTDVGLHFYSWMEYIETSDSTAITFFGNLTSTTGRVTSGILGTIFN